MENFFPFFSDRREAELERSKGPQDGGAELRVRRHHQDHQGPILQSSMPAENFSGKLSSSN
jgi:hypothetical protein